MEATGPAGHFARLLGGPGHEAGPGGGACGCQWSPVHEAGNVWRRAKTVLCVCWCTLCCVVPACMFILLFYVNYFMFT